MIEAPRFAFRPTRGEQVGFECWHCRTGSAVDSSYLQSCTWPSFFFTANINADINNAMQAMFAQALAAARLTN